MLTVCTWLWGDKYGPADVAKLASGVDRNFDSSHRFVVIADDINAPRLKGGPWKVYPIERQDYNLLREKGCFARLRMFDPEWLETILRSRVKSDKVVCLDLDTVITGDIYPLFNRPEPFVILHGANQVNKCLFNGSLMMLRHGAHPEVWNDFSLEAAAKIPFHEFPDDQGWIWHKLPNTAGWKCGPESGVYSFQKTTWPKGEALPADARMVVFPGWRSPQKFKHLPWIKKHWMADDRSGAGVSVHSRESAKV